MKLYRLTINDILLCLIEHFQSKYFRIKNIEFKKEADNYILFSGVEYSPFNSEATKKKNILVDDRKIVWVIDADTEITSPWNYCKQKNKYGVSVQFRKMKNKPVKMSLF